MPVQGMAAQNAGGCARELSTRIKEKATRPRSQGKKFTVTFGLWRVCFPPILISLRTDRRLLVYCTMFSCSTRLGPWSLVFGVARNQEKLTNFSSCEWER